MAKKRPLAAPAISDIIQQLGMLQIQRFTDLVLYFAQAVDANGRPSGEPQATSSHPPQIWPVQELAELWSKTAPLFGKDALRADLQDGGLGRFLFARSQRIADSRGVQATIVDPLEVWITALRELEHKPTAIMVGTAIVEPDPQRATIRDLHDVAAKAEFVATQLTRFTVDLKAMSNRLDAANQQLNEAIAEQWSEVEIVEIRQELSTCRHAYKIKRRDIQHLQQDLAVVQHYATTLLPKELGECVELCANNWMHIPPEFDDAILRKELFTLAALLKGLAPSSLGDEYVTVRKVVIETTLGISDDTRKRRVQLPEADCDRIPVHPSDLKPDRIRLPRCQLPRSYCELHRIPYE